MSPQGWKKLRTLNIYIVVPQRVKCTKIYIFTEKN